MVKNLCMLLLLLLLAVGGTNGLQDCSTNTSSCSAGFRCSPSSVYLCLPCVTGQYCPASTFISNETDIGSITCSSGSYCPTPSTTLPCPAGFFCTSGTSSPISCSYTALLASAHSTSLPRSPTTVLAAAGTGTPIGTTYCPAGSSNGTTFCSKGYYCPNATAMIICPQGYYCKAYSTSPTPCPSVLTSCPEGTSTPKRSYLAFVIAGIIVLSLVPIYFALGYVDSKFIIRDNREKEKKPGVLKMSKSRMMSSKALPLSTSVVADGTYLAFRKISPSLTLTFEEVGLTLHQAKNPVILHKVSGSFEGGHINACMGPSGSGKTTFLSLISGRINFPCTLTGEVRVNGETVDHEVLRKVTGFVPQDDIVHSDLTVEENFSFASRLKLPLQAQKICLFYVQDALTILQLGHIKHKIVGSVEERGISGGQRKRVSIGLELVGSPSILFLDEPTSGLDSTAALDVLTSLGELADLGMTIVASVHQPRFNAYSLFDKVLFLAPGGKMVFLGPPAVASSWFSVLGFPVPPHENPADFFMDVICGKIRSQAGKFHPSLLTAWWEAHGCEWTEEYDQLNMHAKRGPGQLKDHQQKFNPDEIQDLCTEFETLVRVNGQGAVNEKGIAGLFHLPEEDARLLFLEMIGATDGKQEDVMDKERFTQALLLYGISWGPQSQETANPPTEVILPPAPRLSYEVLAAEIQNELLSDPDQEEGSIFMSSEPRPLHDAVGQLSFPSKKRQLVILLQRSAVKYVRHFWPVRIFDVCILVGAAIIVGLITKTSWDRDAFPGKIVLAMACLAVLGTISFARTFMNDVLSLRREVESGISISAYFLTMNLVDLLWLFVAPAFYFGPVYYLMLPTQGFIYFYLVGALVLWWCSGLAYLCAIALPSSAVLMTSVFITLIFGVFANGIVMSIAANRGSSEFILGLSFNRFAFEILTLKEYSFYLDGLRTSIVAEFLNWGVCRLDTYDGSMLQLLLTFDINETCKKYVNTGFGALAAIGFGFRLAAWIVLKIKTMRTYPKVVMVVLRVGVRVVSRLSSRAMSNFGHHEANPHVGPGPGGLPRVGLGGRNKVAPLDIPNPAPTQEEVKKDTKGIKSEATLDDPTMAE